MTRDNNLNRIFSRILIGGLLYFHCSSPLLAVDVVLPPGSEAAAATPASNSTAPPTKAQVVNPVVPKNLIEKYYATAFADYWGPSPWRITSTP